MKKKCFLSGDHSDELIDVGNERPESHQSSGLISPRSTESESHPREEGTRSSPAKSSEPGPDDSTTGTCMLL